MIKESEKHNFRHVAVNSPEHIEMKGRKGKKKSKAFGESSLYFIELEIERLKETNNVLTDKEREQIIEKRLGCQKSILLKIIETDAGEDEMFKKKQEAVIDFFKESMKNEILREELSKALGCTTKKLSLGKIIGGLRDNILSIDYFYRMLKNHVIEFHKKVEKLKPEIEKYRKEFFESAQNAIIDGYLSIDEEELNLRLEKQESGVFDAIEKPHLGEHEGEGTISVSSNMSPDSLRHVVYHESVHAVGGKSIATYKEEGIDMIFEQKHGLRFRLEGPNKDMIVGRFSWLDEAVTE